MPKKHWVIVSFVKTGEGKIVYWPVYMNICTYFPHLLTDPSKMRYTRSEYNAMNAADWRTQRDKQSNSY